MEEPMKVKISGDGAKMSRTTNFMLLSFSLLQTGEKVMSSKGNRTLCIVNGPEKYDTLKSLMGNVISEINSVIKNGKIDVDRKVSIEMCLGGDYKFLLMTMGLRGATCDYACIWCEIHKLQRWDMTKDLDFYNTGDMKRTLQEIKDFHKSGTYDWTSLIGSDKKKLLHLLPTQLESRDILFPETKETVIKIWRDFESLYHVINSDRKENENLPLDVLQKSKEFVKLFCSFGGSRVGYNKACVTP